MAIASFFDPGFTGSLGDYSAYRRKDSKKLILRRKGGASAEQFKKSPKMAGVRAHQIVFGSWSKMGKSIRAAMFNVSKLGHSHLSSQINTLCQDIYNLDAEPAVGSKRSILVANGLHMLQGYNLNKVNTFDSVISTPVTAVLNRQQFKATVSLPPLNPGSNFMNPWDSPYFKIKINLGIVRDMYFDGKEYRTFSSSVLDTAELIETDWLYVNDTHAAQTFELQLDEPSLDVHAYMLVAIGIEFGAQRKGGIKAVKDACCGKILVVG